MKRILINCSYSDELRVALVDGAKLFDLDNEFNAESLLKGSIFKATVSRVETSLDAAFVNFGSERHGFLPLKELSNDYFTKDADGRKKCSLKEGDHILVQVLKEERGTKGAALSNQISLAGRFIVLIPNSEKSGGVSRRISGDERDDIKDALNALQIPDGMSVIVRTAGLGRSTDELKWDLDYLISLWEQIKSSVDDAPSPSLIYKDDKLILRVFRDYFRDDIEEILIDDEAVHAEALDFAKSVIPDHADKVIYYNEDISLFNRYQIESQIELAFQREISLPSGGSIVIDPTEAMVSIDVNSARSTKGKDIESTAFTTNMEAAKEIARQLRLRDLGGLIVIDFIDMQDEKNQQKVENTFRSAVQSDRARVQIAGISRFGLLELSRQRLRPSLEETYDIQHVQIRGTRSLGQSILRIIGEDAAKENTGEIHVYVPADVSSYLLNEKRRDIIAIENTYQVNIVIIADPYKSRPYYKVARVKAVAGKKPFSYDMTPNSPEPSMDWRDTNSNKKVLKPIVNVSVPPRMPKKKKNIGIIEFIKSVLTLSIFKSNKKKDTRKKRTRNYKKTDQRAGKKIRSDRNTNQRGRHNYKNKSSNQNKAPNNQTSKPVVIPPKKSNQTNPKDMIVEKSSENKDVNKPLKNSSEAPTPAP
ncbi:MAG: Rne/Rng family ribonuclease, partial [SAR86 cluster bacterium]|nr:Rne/Rng family ribonuclease [SAR86 cluster bacterium]